MPSFALTYLALEARLNMRFGLSMQIRGSPRSPKLLKTKKASNDCYWLFYLGEPLGRVKYLVTATVILPSDRNSDLTLCVFFNSFKSHHNGMN